MLKKGQVIKSIAGFFDVLYNDEIIRLRGSGNLRNKNKIPLVGDYVEFNDEGMLINILDRKNFLARPKVANIDQMVIVMSLFEPSFSSILLDRLLAIIEYQKIKPIILFTKSDLGSHQPFNDYLSQGYECFLINNKDKKFNFDSLKQIFQNKLTVFTGQSGVGKSTTINNILNENIKTGEISKALGRGKHTTRVVEIYFQDKIRIIDTPGFGSIEINLTKEELAISFHDFDNWSKKCKFTFCLHNKEENCYVKLKLSEGKLLKSRYNNYLKILESCSKKEIIQCKNN